MVCKSVGHGMFDMTVCMVCMVCMVTMTGMEYFLCKVGVLCMACMFAIVCMVGVVITFHMYGMYGMYDRYDRYDTHLLGTCYLLGGLRNTHTPSKYLRATYSHIYMYVSTVSTSYLLLVYSDNTTCV